MGTAICQATPSFLEKPHSIYDGVGWALRIQEFFLTAPDAKKRIASAANELFQKQKAEIDQGRALNPLTCFQLATYDRLTHFLDDKKGASKNGEAGYRNLLARMLYDQIFSDDNFTLRKGPFKNEQFISILGFIDFAETEKEESWLRRLKKSDPANAFGDREDFTVFIETRLHPERAAADFEKELLKPRRLEDMIQALILYGPPTSMDLWKILMKIPKEKQIAIAEKRSWILEPIVKYLGFDPKGLELLKQLPLERSDALTDSVIQILCRLHPEQLPKQWFSTVFPKLTYSKQTEFFREWGKKDPMAARKQAARLIEELTNENYSEEKNVSYWQHNIYRLFTREEWLSIGKTSRSYQFRVTVLEFLAERDELSFQDLIDIYFDPSTPFWVRFELPHSFFHSPSYKTFEARAQILSDFLKSDHSNLGSQSLVGNFAFVLMEEAAVRCHSDAQRNWLFAVLDAQEKKGPLYRALYAGFVSTWSDTATNPIYKTALPFPELEYRPDGNEEMANLILIRELEAFNSDLAPYWKKIATPITTKMAESACRMGCEMLHEMRLWMNGKYVDPKMEVLPQRNFEFQSTAIYLLNLTYLTKVAKHCSEDERRLAKQILDINLDKGFKPEYFHPEFTSERKLQKRSFQALKDIRQQLKAWEHLHQSYEPWSKAFFMRLLQPISPPISSGWNRDSGQKANFFSENDTAFLSTLSTEKEYRSYGADSFDNNFAIAYWLLHQPAKVVEKSKYYTRLKSWADKHPQELTRFPYSAGFDDASEVEQEAASRSTVINFLLFRHASTDAERVRYASAFHQSLTNVNKYASALLLHRLRSFSHLKGAAPYYWDPMLEPALQGAKEISAAMGPDSFKEALKQQRIQLVFHILSNRPKGKLFHPLGKLTYPESPAWVNSLSAMALLEQCE